jgi:hypothetical protein
MSIAQIIFTSLFLLWMFVALWLLWRHAVGGSAHVQNLRHQLAELTLKNAEISQKAADTALKASEVAKAAAEAVLKAVRDK